MSIAKIEGIGPVRAEQLAKAGIKGINGLLKKGATPKGRDEIVKNSGLSKDQVLKYVNLADLFRVKGIGTQYSELLEAAGVDTVKELAQRNPDNLYQAIQDTNKQKKLVRQTPGKSNVKSWIEQAKKLPRMIDY
jgi:predicted flap endonuclease-1-like 5' DNA nuclease